MRLWCKLLPFFIVEWMAIERCGTFRINGWNYVQPFGPGDSKRRRRSVLIEVDPSERPDWNVREEEEHVRKAQSSLALTKMRYGIKETPQ